MVMADMVMAYIAMAYAIDGLYSYGSAATFLPKGDVLSTLKKFMPAAVDFHAYQTFLRCAWGASMSSLQALMPSLGQHCLGQQYLGHHYLLGPTLGHNFMGTERLNELVTGTDA